MVNLIEEIRNLKVEDSSLFKEVKFCMIECSEEDEIKKLLFGGGARQISYMSDMVTHVIADSDESADVSEAQEIFEIPVVTCKWVLMSVRCKVLLPIEGFSPVSIQLFSGVVACPSKLSKKDRNSLWAMVTYNGGKFQITFDKSCTHLVASLPEGEKYQKAVEHNVKIVTPDWIVDSVKSKEKCDEELYHTRLLILPKSPTPSPPPAPPIEHAVITSANDRFVASGHVFHRQQNAATSIVHTVMPSSTPQSNIANQQVTWHQQVPQPQQQRMTVGTNSDFVRSSTVIWQQRPTQIVSTVPGGPNQRSMIWQQQLAAQGRLTPQHQQVILQQNRFQHQQQASIRQLGQQRAQIPNQQIPMSQQQHRSPSPQMHLIQRHQIPNSQHITISQQSSIPQQIPLVNQRIQAPTQQIQISQSHRQLSPNQQQQLQTQQLQHQQLQRASSQQMQLNVIQQSPTKASPRMHLVTQRQPLTAQHLDQVRASQQQAMNVQHRSPTRQQLSPQQQMLWQQQQRPGGRMIMQQQQQQQIGVRQVQYQVQTQGQPRLSSQQQVIWQQKQMMMTNQRQPVNRIQFSTMTPRMVTRQTIPAHPPPPYPGKVRPQTETTVIQQPNLPPESNQQQQQQSPVSIQQVVSINSAGQIVTPKTKTALANLLNNRLHHEIISPICKPDMVEANNISQTIAKADTVRRKDPSTPDKPAPKPTILLFGHEPNVRVPPELCLAGCTFCMIDYNPSDENNRLNDWKKLIINHGGKVEDNYSSQCTHVICDNAKNPIMQQAMREGKRCVTAFWLNDTLITKKMLPPSKALHLPTPCLQDKPCKRQMITTIGFEGEDSRMLKNMICTSGAKYTGYMCKFNTLIIAKKLEGLKYVKGQEWKIPIVNVQWMNDILLGIYDALRSLMAARYQNYNMEDVFKLDFTSIHPLMYSWRMPIKITDVSLSDGATRVPLRTIADINCQHSKQVEPPSKRFKLSVPDDNSTLRPKPRIMFSGIADTTELTNIVVKLGGCVTMAAQDCTHLVVKEMKRTIKLFCCITTCDFVVAQEWLIESNKQNRFLDEEMYIPDKPEMDLQLGFNIKRTLLRKNRTPVLKGYSFYLTPSVPPSYETLCLIIESAGGKVIKNPLKISEIQNENKASVKLIIISCDNDIHLCHKFFKHKINVYNPEFILTGVMNQYIDLDIFQYSPTTIN